MSEMKTITINGMKYTIADPDSATMGPNGNWWVGGQDTGIPIKDEGNNTQEGCLPAVTDADNGKFLQVANGVWIAVDAVPQVNALITNYVNSMFIPVTQEEYDALVAAGTMDPSKYYMRIGGSQ